MNCAFYTLGCKLNQCESEALASSFRSQGFSVLSHNDQADLYFINTCTVTSKAEQKARRMIRLLSRTHPDSVVVVTGCYAQLNSTELEELGANVLLVSHDNKDIILDLPEYLSVNSMVQQEMVSLYEAVRTFVSTRSGEIPVQETRFRYKVDEFSYHTRAFLKIQDGCNNRCAYCRVPLARGNSVSLALTDVVSRVSELMDHGYREVVLTGVNISSYKSGDSGLTQLLQALVPVVKNRGRIRLSSIEPDYVDEDFITVIKNQEICPHFHLPLQTGSDSVLQGMGRKYDTDRIKSVLSMLFNAVESPFVAADIIVGFPGETEGDFYKTRELLKSFSFSHLHVFPYSPRPGTPAVDMKPKVPESVSRRRASELRELSEGWEKNYFRQWEGRAVQVLIEKVNMINGVDLYSGITHNYLKVLVQKAPEIQPGVLVQGILRYSEEHHCYLADVFPVK